MDRMKGPFEPRLVRVIAIAGLGAMLIAFAAEQLCAASATADINAEILPSATVTAVSTLRVSPRQLQTFGSDRNIGFVPEAGALPIGRNGNAGRSAGLVQQGSTGMPAMIAITGEPNQVVAISLPNETILFLGDLPVAVFGYSLDAGLTPSIDGSGRGFFKITAVPDAALGDETPKSPGGTSTFPRLAIPTVRNPSDRLIVATRAPAFDLVVSYN